MKARLFRSLTATLILLVVAVLISGTCALAEDDITSSNPVEDSVTEINVARYEKRITELEWMVLSSWILTVVMVVLTYRVRTKEVNALKQKLEDAKARGYVKQ